MESLKNDSDKESIEDTKQDIEKFLKRFDLNSEFYKYLEDALRKAVEQLKLEEYIIFPAENSLLVPPESIPNSIVNDYWLKFQSLENEEIFKNFSQEKYDEYKKRKNAIQKKIVSLMESLKNDSDKDSIEDTKQDIEKFLKRFDLKSEFYKYLEDALRKAVEQLKLEDYIIFPNPPKPESDILEPSDVEPHKYHSEFQKELLSLELKDLFYKHQKLLQIFGYFEQLKIKNLLKEKYPDCQVFIQTNIVGIMRKVYDHIEQEDVLNEQKNKRLYDEINPMFVQIYEDEYNQEYSSLCDQPPLHIYQFIVGLVQTACPYITIQKPLSLQEQQIEQFQQLKELLPSLGKKITIQEYGTLDENSNIQDQIKLLIEDYKKNSKLNGEILLKILYDLIKRRVDFKELLQELSRINNKINLTQLILFQYILEHSDPQLKVLICVTCAYFISLPLLAFNPWQENQEMDKLQMTPEVLYIYEKSKSLIQFKLSSNKKIFLQSKSLNGCTLLLNKLFGREFSLHEQNFINFGTVEMQMDLNCADVQHLVIADAHGFIDIQTLKQIFPLFDGFIVHVSENDFQDKEIQSNLDLLFNEIPSESNSEKTILIIKHDCEKMSYEPKQWQNISDIRLKIFEICTQNLQKLSETNQQNLIQSIHNTLGNYFKIDIETYKSTPEMRLESKQTFLNVMKQINYEQNIIKHQEAHIRLCKIINLIKSQNNLKGTDFLPMLNYISRQSKLQEIIISENHSKKEKDDARHDLKQIQRVIKDEQSTKISNLFSEIVFNHQCMNLLPSLSSIVRGFLESKLEVIIKKRDEKKDELLKTDVEQKETLQILQQQIKKLNQEVDEKWFSTELLSRELFYLGQNSEKSTIKKEDYYQLVRHFEQTAQPFELVDGDTLNFTTDVYQNVFQDYDHEDLLVVCVLGPQSSGKSLLMNYLFGTSFLSSSGRCTKGVYSSILRFKDKDGNYKRILILDTEGIQSAEARDTTFDRRIVYYAICVSHVVLMCNKGEMNQPMSETIKLVADAIMNTSMPFLKNPTIYIILNMLSNPNDRTQLECINEVNQTLKELAAAAATQPKTDEEVYSRKMVDQVLKINQDSLFPLGFAFNTFQFGSEIKRTVNKPSPEFANKTMQLRESILSKFKEIQNSKSTKYTLRDWFNHAQSFWTFSRDCKSLKEYSSLGQKRTDDELMLEIERLIKENYVDNWKSVLKVQIKSELDAIFDQYQGGAAINFQSLNNKIQAQVTERYNLIQDRVLEQYKNFCQDKSISNDLMQKRKQDVNRKKDSYEKQALQYCRVNLSKFQEQKSQLVGDTILHEETIRLLKEKESYEPQEAIDEFQKSWTKSIELIKNGLSNNEELINTSQKSVTDEFRYLLNHTPQYDIDYFDLARKGNQDEWQKKLINQFKKDGLMFSGDQIGPNIKFIIESQERQRKYTNEKQIRIFEDRTTYTYFKWWAALKSIIQTDKLGKKISEKLFQRNRNIFIKAYDQLTQDEREIRNEIKRQLKEIIDKFKEENKKLGFIFSADEQTFINLLNGNSIDYDNIQKQLKNILESQKYFSCIEYINPLKTNKQYQENLTLREIAQKLNFEYFTLYDSQQAYYKIEDYIEKHVSSLSIDQAFPININTDIEFLDNIQSYMGQNNEESANFGYYLEYLKNPHTQKALSHINKAGQEFFFNSIMWELVFQDIELAIIKNYKINGQIQVQLKIKDYLEILAKNDSESEKLTSEFNKMTQKLARGIFSNVNEIIKKIDEEIEAFCMKVSEQGKVFIFLVTQIFTSLLTEKLDLIRESYPLRQFMSRKQIEENLFIAKLTQNSAEMDKSLAEKFAEHLCSYFYNESLERAQQLFKMNMDQQQNAFQKVNFITQMEEQCEKMYDSQEADSSYKLTPQQVEVRDDLVDYYMDPSNFLEGKFQEEFKKVSSGFLNNCKKEFSKIYQAKAEKILSYFVRLQDCLEKSQIDKNSDALFLPDISCQVQWKNLINDGTVNQQQLQKKAASYYLKQLLKDSWTSDSELTFGAWKFITYNDHVLPRSCEIQNPENQRFDALIHNMMGNYFEEKIEISNIYKFVETVVGFFYKVKTLEGYLQEKNLVIKDHILLGASYQDFRNKFLGCQEVCPLCRKQCDQIHGQNEVQQDLIHDCQLGHQLQGFGGSKTQDENIAITISCNNLKDNDFVVFKGQDMKWSELKDGQLKNWNFQKDLAQIKFARKSQVKLWNLIGNIVCDRYSKECGNKIEWQRAEQNFEPDEKKLIKVHYIMMLDDSGSMEGQPWTDLKTAFGTFISALTSTKELIDNSKISCIQYSTQAYLSFKNLAPDRSMLNKINFRGGASEFDYPLNMAFKLCQEFYLTNDKIQLYFLTDGDGDMPTVPLKAFNDNTTFKKKIEFFAVGFGKHADMKKLTKIANQMPKGKVSEAPTVKELTQSFNEIILGDYERKN